jgi:hypothetical protein
MHSLLEIGMVVISAVSSLDEHLSQKILCPEMFVTSRCTVFYSALPYQGTHPQMPHEQQQKILMQSNVRE